MQRQCGGGCGHGWPRGLCPPPLVLQGSSAIAEGRDAEQVVRAAWGPGLHVGWHGWGRLALSHSGREVGAPERGVEQEG